MAVWREFLKPTSPPEQKVLPQRKLPLQLMPRPDAKGAVVRAMTAARRAEGLVKRMVSVEWVDRWEGVWKWRFDLA